jgi:hypothetical protein
MTGWHVLSAVLVLLLGNVVPSFAQASRANPYKNLFKPPDLKAVARAQQSDSVTRAREPRVVCGMKVIPADPSIDPKMIIPRPPDGTRYTMRVIPPPICK